MNKRTHRLLLADDDSDDCFFFEEALEELSILTELTIVNDGQELMDMLLTKDIDLLPDMLFLDLNMPLKTGFDCLIEIKNNKNLKQLPVVIFSTSFDQKMVDLLYTQGAHYYISKPAEFSKLKEIIHTAISLISASAIRQPNSENFVLYSG